MTSAAAAVVAVVAAVHLVLVVTRHVGFWRVKVNSCVYLPDTKVEIW